MGPISRGLGIVICLWASTTLADDPGYTTVMSPGSEAGHDELLANALGGAFAASGLDFSNGSISAIRNLDQSDSLMTDQIWSAGNYHATMIGHEGSRDSVFGFVDGTHHGQFESLLDTDDLGSSASSSHSDDFRWALKVDGIIFDSTYTSRESDNHGNDMMVSYSLYNFTGSFMGSMLFFEDRLHFGDRDFNDVAVLLSIVPTPQAASMGGLALLIGLGASRRRRFIR